MRDFLWLAIAAQGSPALGKDRLVFLFNRIGHGCANGAGADAIDRDRLFAQIGR